MTCTGTPVRGRVHLGAPDGGDQMSDVQRGFSLADKILCSIVREYTSFFDVLSRTKTPMAGK